MLSIIKWFSRPVLGKVRLKIEFATGIGSSNLFLQRQKSGFSEIPLNSFFFLYHCRRTFSVNLSVAFWKHRLK